MSRPGRQQVSAETLLRHQPLFRELDPRTVARLAQAATRRLLRRGDLLFRRGDLPTGMYVVVYGGIKLLAADDSRGTRLAGLVRHGGSFGEPVMFLQRPALVDAVASEDSLVLHLPSEAIFAELDDNPLLARKMLAALSLRVESLVHELERQAAGSGRARLIRYLLAQATTAGGSVLLPASKAAIASQLNLTPEHFSRLLHGLVADGLVEVQGRRVGLLDRELLAAAAAVRPPRRRGARATAPAPGAVA